MRQVTLKLFLYHLDFWHFHQSSSYARGPPYRFYRALGPVSFVDPQDVEQSYAASALALSREMCGQI